MFNAIVMLKPYDENKQKQQGSNKNKNIKHNQYKLNSINEIMAGKYTLQVETTVAQPKNQG